MTACFLLSAILGPSVLIVTSQAISNGKRAALICILGELLGGICLMILSLLGVGAIVAASPTAFEALKWLGVAYLLYLGVNELRSALTDRQIENTSGSARGSFKVGYWTALFNPKSLVFLPSLFYSVHRCHAATGATIHAIDCHGSIYCRCCSWGLSTACRKNQKSIGQF